MDNGTVAIASGMIVPIAFFALVGALIIVPRYFKSRERQALQSTLRAAIERGQPLPPEVIEAITRDAKPTPSPTRDLRIGIIWIGVGLGLAAMAYAMGYASDDASEAFWPLLGLSGFPFFVGLAFVVMGLVNRNKAKV